MKSKYVKKHECVIIGGGAAGMMAAVQLAGYGIDNCIIEHTGKIGSKILQTGNIIHKRMGMYIHILRQPLHYRMH